MRPTVRNFRPGDEQRVSEIHSENSQHFEEDHLPPAFIAETAGRSDFHILISEVDGKITGFCGMYYRRNVGRAEIGPLAVDRHSRREKTGERLLESALEFLRQAGIHRVTAVVKTGNHEAIKFFTRNHFREEAVLEKYTRRMEDAVQLVHIIRDHI